MLFTQTTLEVFWLTLYKKFFEGQVTYIHFEFLKIFRALNSPKNCHIEVWIHSRLEWNHTNLEWVHSTYEWIHDNSGIPILQVANKFSPKPNLTYSVMAQKGLFLSKSYLNNATGTSNSKNFDFFLQNLLDTIKIFDFQVADKSSPKPNLT